MVEVDSTDVVRVILQFLLENKLEATAACLVRESNVRLTALTEDQQTALRGMLDEGRWLDLLGLLTSLHVEQTSTLTDLFAHVVHELSFAGQAEAARALLARSGPLGEQLQRTDPERYLRLQELSITEPAMLSDPRPMRAALSLGGLFKGRVQAGRLLTLVGQAASSQPLRDPEQPADDECTYDPFLDIYKTKATQHPFTTLGSAFPLANDDADCFALVSLTNSSNYLAMGDRDGFISLASIRDGSLAMQAFPYQSQASSMMVMESAVSILQATNHLLLAHAASGETLLWDVRAGDIVQRWLVPDSLTFLHVLFNQSVSLGFMADCFYVYSQKTGAQLHQVRLPQVPSAVFLHEREGVLLVGYKNGTLEVFSDPSDWSKRRMIPFSDNAYTPISSIVDAQEENQLTLLVSCGRLLKRLTCGAQGYAFEDRFFGSALAPISFLATHGPFAYAVDDSHTVHVLSTRPLKTMTTITGIGEEHEHVVAIFAWGGGLLIVLQNYDYDPTDNNSRKYQCLPIH